MSETKNEFCIYYNACESNFHEIMSIGRCFEITSGTSASLSASYINKISVDSFNLQYSTNKEGLFVDVAVNSSELNNPNSGGYINSTGKMEILSRIEKYQTNATSIILPNEINKNDLASVLCAKENKGIVFCADYHEAGCAIHQNVPYVFLIDGCIKYERLRDYRKNYIREVYKNLNKLKKYENN
jgi:hypothetical protein